MDEPRIGFLYLRDPKCPRRVLTVGWQHMGGNLLRLAWALNRLEYDQVAFATDGFKPRVKKITDLFNKSVGRSMVKTRLKTDTPRFRLTIPFTPGSNVTNEVVIQLGAANGEHWVNPVPHAVQRLARRLYVARFQALLKTHREASLVVETASLASSAE